MHSTMPRYAKKSWTNICESITADIEINPHWRSENKVMIRIERIVAAEKEANGLERYL